MIQRKQTVYLLLSVILMAIYSYMPIGSMQASEQSYTFSILGLSSSLNNSVVGFTNYWPLIIPFAFTALMNLVAIFMYKRRQQQAKLTILSMFLQLGVLALTIVYAYYLLPLQIDNLKLALQFSLAFPVVNIVLTYLALKGIRKDEALIKSMDRIR